MALMSLNGRIALVAAAALLTCPVWIWCTPVALIRWRQSARAARAAGLHSLTMLQARAIVAHAEASLVTPPPDGWFVVARNVDRYLTAVDSPRHWRSHAVLVALEFAPLLRLQRPLSRLPLDARRAFLSGPLATTRGLLAIPSLARQLIRMGYYADPAVAARIGFRPFTQRRRSAGGAG